MPDRFFAGQTNYIAELNALDGESGDAQQAIDDHIADTAGAHAATAISNTPAGNIAATTVQAAINELDTEKLSASATTLPASFTGSSLTSLGTLTALAVSGESAFAGNVLASGKVGIGTAALTNYSFLNGLALTGQTTMIGNGTVTQVNSDVTSLAVGYRSNLYTQAASFTCGAFYGFHAVQSTLGASSSVSFQAGFLASSTLTGATSNYGFYSEIASGSGRWNFYAAGTAANYFAGATTFADTLTVTGQASFAAGSAAAPSVKVGGEQNGLFSSTANTLDVTVGGLRQARFMNVASAVNYGQLQGASTGFAPIWSSQGSDTNINWIATSKGSGGVLLYTNLGTALQLAVTHTASAVNWAQVTGSATGNYIGFSAVGSDTNIGITYTAKGTGTHDFYARSGINFRAAALVDSAVNYFTASGQATGTGPLLLAGGSDTNVSARYRTQGTGTHTFETGSSGNIGLVVTHTPSAVNYPTVTGGSAGNPVAVQAAGADTNIPLGLYTKGNATVFAVANGAVSFATANPTGAVNYLDVRGSATGNAVTASTVGSDSNIDFAITPKGAGNVRFGTHSAIAAETVTGYITIKDAAGNSRKLAVLS